MSDHAWNEEGRIWEDDHTLLDDEQTAQCARAHEAGLFRSPVPTQMVSNGEYMPAPQTEKQKHVEARVKELAESASKRLGMDRRRFLTSTGGMAAAFLAMNEVFGRFFDVDPIEMFEPAAYAQTGAPSNLFVFDDQLHLVRGSRGNTGAALRALAQGPSSPAQFQRRSAAQVWVPGTDPGCETQNTWIEFGEALWDQFVRQLQACTGRL